jgi:hypothetical protein
MRLCGVGGRGSAARNGHAGGIVNFLGRFVRNEREQNQSSLLTLHAVAFAGPNRSARRVGWEVGRLEGQRRDTI